MNRARLLAKPAARKACRANCWRSGSGSTVVSTPSGRMPCSRWMPDTPVPVPISATALASTVAASNRRAAPAPGDTERSPASRARSRAQCSASSSATKASANAQLVCRLAVMTLSCPRCCLGVTVSVGVGNPQMGPGVKRGEEDDGGVSGGRR